MRQPIIHEEAYICTYVYDIHIVGVISKYVVRKRNLFFKYILIQINERSDKEAWIGSQDKGKYLIILVVDLEARHVTTTVQINQMVKQSR